MRKSLWIFALIGAAGMATQVRAQTTSSVGGINPRAITFTPVDTTKFLAAPVVFPQSSGFSLLNFLPRFGLPTFSARPTIGVSPLPPPGSFPSTHYPSAFTPMAPFTPPQ